MQITLGHLHTIGPGCAFQPPPCHCYCPAENTSLLSSFARLLPSNSIRLWSLPFSWLPMWLLHWYQVFLKRQCQPTVCHPVISLSVLPLKELWQKQFPIFTHPWLSATQPVPAYFAKKKSFHPFLCVTHCDDNLYCQHLWFTTSPKCFLNASACRQSLRS